MAAVPRSVRWSLYRQGLRRVFAGWSPPFVDSWNLVSKVSVIVSQTSEPFDLHICREILVKHIPVNIGPFCNAVERLCGLLILSYRFTTRCGTLHGVTLPRSWVLALSRSLPLLDKSINYIAHFVNDTIELLRRIDNQQFDHYGPRPATLYESVYIARM